MNKFIEKVYYNTPWWDDVCNDFLKVVENCLKEAYHSIPDVTIHSSRGEKGKEYSCYFTLSPSDYKFFPRSFIKKALKEKYPDKNIKIRSFIHPYLTNGDYEITIYLEGAKMKESTIRDYYDNFEKNHPNDADLYGPIVKELLYDHPLYKKVFDKAKELGYKVRRTCFLDGRGGTEDSMSISIPSFDEKKFPKDLGDFIESLGLVHYGKKHRGASGYIFKFELFEKNRWPEEKMKEKRVLPEDYYDGLFEYLVKMYSGSDKSMRDIWLDISFEYGDYDLANDVIKELKKGTNMKESYGPEPIIWNKKLYDYVKECASDAVEDYISNNDIALYDDEFNHVVEYITNLFWENEDRDEGKKAVMDALEDPDIFDANISYAIEQVAGKHVIDDPISTRDYLLRKEECCPLDKEEMFILQDLIQRYGKPDVFEESKMKESTWTVEVYDPKTNKTIEKKSGFGSDRAACEYGDHTLEDLEEQGIEADYDTFQESKLKESISGLKITNVSVEPKWIYDTFKGPIRVKATINGKEATFSFEAARSGDVFFAGVDCNSAVVLRKSDEDMPSYLRYGRGITISNGGTRTHYALQIHASTLKSAPKENQKDFRFTGQYYSTKPVKDIFKQKLETLYQDNELTQEFLDYFEIPPYGTDPATKSSDSVEKMKKWQAGEREFNLKAASDAKLKANLKICQEIGFEDGAEKIKQELESREIDFQESKIKESSYSDIPLIDKFEFKDNKPHKLGIPLPGINDISGFIKAAERVGKDQFKVRSTRVSFSNADIKDSWMDLERKGWSVREEIDDSLPGFNEVYIFSKIKEDKESKIKESDHYSDSEREIYDIEANHDFGLVTCRIKDDWGVSRYFLKGFVNGVPKFTNDGNEAHTYSNDLALEKAAKKVKQYCASQESKLKEAKDFDPDAFEAMIPHNMRWKHLEDCGDLLYWVTQDDFDEEDLEEFKRALATTDFKRAYVIVRDYSHYDKKEDFESDLGYFVEAPKSFKSKMKEADEAQIDFDLKNKRLSLKDAKALRNIDLKINSEDYALFVEEIRDHLKLEDIKEVDYADPLEGYDGAYKITLKDGSIKYYDWKDFVSGVILRKEEAKMKESTPLADRFVKWYDWESEHGGSEDDYSPKMHRAEEIIDKYLGEKGFDMNIDVAIDALPVEGKIEIKNFLDREENQSYEEADYEEDAEFVSDPDTGRVWYEKKGKKAIRESREFPYNYTVRVSPGEDCDVMFDVLPDILSEYSGDAIYGYCGPNSFCVNFENREDAEDFVKRTDHDDIKVEVSFQEKMEEHSLRDDYTLFRKFEKEIPYSMRYKEYDIVDDTLYWITQEPFSEYDVHHFVDAFENLIPLRKALIICRDYSTYNFIEDRKSEKSVFIDLDE